MLLSNNKYNYYFYTVLTIIVCILLLKANLSLSISYKEALNVFINNSILTIITNTFLYINPKYGRNKNIHYMYFYSTLCQ